MLRSGFKEERLRLLSPFLIQAEMLWTFLAWSTAKADVNDGEAAVWLRCCRTAWVMPDLACAAFTFVATSISQLYCCEHFGLTTNLTPTSGGSLEKVCAVWTSS